MHYTRNAAVVVTDTKNVKMWWPVELQQWHGQTIMVTWYSSDLAFRTAGCITRELLCIALCQIWAAATAGGGGDGGVVLV
jgi:hypothetical protein